MSHLKVLSPGVRSLIQDCGRPGQKALGIPVGGAFDGYSYRWANHLLNNPPNSPTIEIEVGLARFKALKPLHLSLTGSQCEAYIDGQKFRSWSQFLMRPGQQLSIKASKTGVRSYLAVQGGFDVAEHLGSSSTDPLLGLGGTHRNGRPLQKGETLKVLSARHTPALPERTQWVSNRYNLNSILPVGTDVVLDIVPCYQFDKFDEKDIDSLTEQTFEVSLESNRMGVRLLGNDVFNNSGKVIENIVSEGIVPGAVQIMPNGLPTILGVDAQTIGGYPKIGVLPLMSRWKLGQLAPKTQVKFRWTSWSEASVQSEAWLRYFGY